MEGQVSDLRLFTISNPVSGSKHPGMVSKWSGHQYTLEKRQKVDGVLSNLALSDDGRYLATGTMDGDIIIFVAFSLQVRNYMELFRDVMLKVTWPKLPLTCIISLCLIVGCFILLM